VAEALSQGIAMIHQELALAENLDVGANVLLGREPRTLGFIRRGEAHARARAALERVGVDLAPGTPVEGMGMGHRQLVEIAKALSADARVLIMDEPTSSLTIGETQALFEVVDALRKSGTSVIYISHRLAEVERIADRVIVLRDGCKVGELTREEINHDAMVRLMVGREVDRVFERETCSRSSSALAIDGVRTHANPGHEISLHVDHGEVVGLAGLVGAGRTELLRTIFGLETPLSGSIQVAGSQRSIDAPIAAIRAGIAFVPEDRKADGLLLEESLRTNVVLPSLRRLARGGFTSGVRERKLARELIELLHIQTRDDRTLVGGLSGGNQQKVVLGKWIAREPDILLLDEPTRGVDVGAKEEIYKLMDRNARVGRAILFASSEMEELLSLADRVYVMHEGRLAGELTRDDLTEERVMRLATGGDRP
jgi:ribose transport system ATP-binding protein